jgi:hypothetical protein
MKTIGRLIIALVLFAVPAFSQGKDFTIFAGYQVPGKVTLSSGTTGVGSVLNDPKNVGTFGVRFGHGKVWGGEHTVAFTSDFLDSNSKAFIYNSNFRITAPFPVVRPYATAGLGTIITWGTGLSDIGSKFAVNYGGGVKIMPGPVGVNVGIRGYAVPGVQSQTLFITEASVGVNFGF